MPGETFDIKVVDKIQASIVQKLEAIRRASTRAAASIRLLNVQLRGLGITTTAVAAGGGRVIAVMGRTKSSIAGTTTAVKGLNTGFLPLIRNFRTIASIAAIIGATRGFVSSIDSFTELQNKLKNVTDSQEQLIKVTTEVARVAREARVPIGDIGKSFQRFDIAVQSLGGSQKESLRITETVSKLLTLQGATVNEARSALLQLSQAFNKGKLDGDEFRSVMELMPKAALEIQRTLGITRAKLFEFAEEGLISSNVLRAAFANLANDTDIAFRRTTVTIGQSLTVLGNAFVIMFGRFDQQVGITRTLSSAFISLADNLQLVAKAVTALSIALTVAFAPRIVATIIAMASGLGFIIPAVIGITAALVFFRDEIKLSADGLVTLGDAARGTFNFLKKLFADLKQFIADIELFDKIMADIRRELKVIGSGFETLGRFIKAATNGVINFVAALGEIALTFSTEELIGLFTNLLKDINNIIVKIFAGLVNLISGLIFKGLQLIAKGLAAVTAQIVGFGDITKDLLDFANNAEFKKITDADLFRAGLLFGGDEFHEAGLKASIIFREAFEKDFISGAIQAGKKFIKPLLQSIREASDLRILDRGTGNEKALLTIRQMTESMRELDIVNGEFEGGIEQSLTQMRPFTAQIKLADASLIQLKIITAQLRDDLPQLFERADAAVKRFAGSFSQLFGTPQQQFQELVNGFQGALQTMQNAVRPITDTMTGFFETMTLDIKAAIERVAPGLFDSWINAFKIAINAIIRAASLGLATGVPDITTNQPGTPIGGIPTQTDKATKSINNLGGSVGNLGQQFGLLETTVASVFSNMGNAIVQFARTGKFDFKQFITSILADMLRFLTNQLTRQFLGVLTGGGSSGGGGGGLFGSLFGGGGGIGGLFGGLFAHGGFTGGGSRRDPAGLVHGQEFVVNAPATRSNRGALESLNRTGRLPVAAGAGTTVGLSVTIINETPAQFEVKRVSPTEVVVIATNVAEGVVAERSGNIVAHELNNPNSKVSKSLRKNFDSKRRR